MEEKKKEGHVHEGKEGERGGQEERKRETD